MTYTPYIWPLIIAALFSASAAFYARRYSDVPSVRPFVAMMLLGVAWQLIYAVSISVDYTPARIVLSILMYIPTRLITFAIFFLIIEYTGRERWLTKRNVALLLAIPVGGILASLTSPWHRLFRYNFNLERVGNIAILHYDGGPIYWLSSAYGDALVVFGLVLLLLSLRSRNLHFWNTVSIFVGIIVPIAVNMLFTAGITPIKGYSFAPTSTIVTGLACLWALFRFRLFSVAPVARSTVVDNLSDPVVVLDTRGHIIDFNAAAAAVFGLDQKKSIGATVETLPADWLGHFSRAVDAENSREEISADIRGSLRVFDAASSRILDSLGRNVGRLYVLHDITELREAETAVKRLLSEKELLLVEVHHRIKNNMSVISSILSLHADSLRGTPGRDALLDARSRVQSMMLLYDRLYRASGTSEISILDYLSPLTDKIVGNFATSPNIALQKNIDDFPVNARTLFPVGIIANELLTNAMKHAFVGRERGTLTVSATLRGDKAVLEIKDDGIGLGAGGAWSAPDSFSAETGEIESGKGFGLQLVNILVRQVKGTLRAEQNGGTTFILEFDRG